MGNILVVSRQAPRNKTNMPGHVYQYLFHSRVLAFSVLYCCSLFLGPFPVHEGAIYSIMSSTGQTTSTSNTQLIIDAALADYTKITGVDLSKNPFAAILKQSNSPEEILQLLQGREHAFKEYRDGNRSLLSCLSPAVKVLQAFSGILGEAVSLVRHTFYLGVFFLLT
jgi:hypothetical protein